MSKYKPSKSEPVYKSNPVYRGSPKPGKPASPTIIRSSRQIIERRLLTDLTTKDKVAILFTLPELNELIDMVTFASWSLKPKVKDFAPHVPRYPTAATLLSDLQQLRQSAFSEHFPLETIKRK